MDIEKSWFINAPMTEVWKALTDAEVMERWGAGPAEMRAEPGGTFSQWGGEIHGTVLEAEPPLRLVEEWYGGDWPAPSIATFILTAERDGTRVTLLHSGLPDDEAADFDTGWDDYYFGPIRELLER